MARIVGVELPKNKRVEIALTYIYGVGLSSSRKILKKLGIDFNRKVNELSTEELNSIRHEIRKYTVEGDLRRVNILTLKKILDLGNYRSIRHRRKLPVRGQRTKTNARTRKGRKRLNIGIKQKN